MRAANTPIRNLYVRIIMSAAANVSILPGVSVELKDIYTQLKNVNKKLSEQEHRLHELERRVGPRTRAQTRYEDSINIRSR